MKNKYIVKFTTQSGAILYIRNSATGTACTTSEERRAEIFTNKEIAADAAAYFLRYKIGEEAKKEIIKL